MHRQYSCPPHAHVHIHLQTSPGGIPPYLSLSSSSHTPRLVSSRLCSLFKRAVLFRRSISVRALLLLDLPDYQHDSPPLPQQRMDRAQFAMPQRTTEAVPLPRGSDCSAVRLGRPKGQGDCRLRGAEFHVLPSRCTDLDLAHEKERTCDHIIDCTDWTPTVIESSTCSSAPTAHRFNGRDWRAVPTPRSTASHTRCAKCMRAI